MIKINKICNMIFETLLLGVCADEWIIKRIMLKKQCQNVINDSFIFMTQHQLHLRMSVI